MKEKKKKEFDENCEDESLTNSEENFQVLFYLAFINTVMSQLDQRFDTVPKIPNKFDF
jgi:hypothetical protein